MEIYLFFAGLICSIILGSWCIKKSTEEPIAIILAIYGGGGGIAVFGAGILAHFHILPLK